MNKFIQAAKKNRQSALAENSGSGSRTAGPGRFKAKLIGAEIGENRQGTAKRAKLTYEVVEVIKGNEEDVGATISEYISENHNSDSQAKRYTALVNQLLDAGVKEEKISDEDDETLWDAIVTAVQAAGKVINKGVEVYAAMDRVQTTKLAENGKPYFNNYFVELSACEAYGEDACCHDYSESNEPDPREEQMYEELRKEEAEVVNAPKTEKSKVVKKTQQAQQANAAEFTDDLPF